MALQLGYLLFDSVNGLACDGTKGPVICNTNAFPVSLVPQYFQDANEQTWWPDETITKEWNTTTGTRNGIGVVIDGTTYVWDVQGDADSSEDIEENSPYAKLAAFLELCKDCENCDEQGVSTLAGEYNVGGVATYPNLPGTSFCYEVTVTDVEDYPSAQDIQRVEMAAGTDLVGAVRVISYDPNTDTAVYHMCLDKAVTSSGSPIGFPANYSFAEA